MSTCGKVHEWFGACVRETGHGGPCHFINTSDPKEHDHG